MGSFSTPEQIQNGLSFWDTNALPSDAPEAYPGFLDEAWKGPLLGVGSGLLTMQNAAVRTMDFALLPVAGALDSVLGTDMRGTLEADSQRATDYMLDFNKNGEKTMGTAGQVLKGFGKVATEAGVSYFTGGALGVAAKAAVPLGVGGAEAVGTYDDMRSKGVDQNTALGMGAVSGVSNAIGVMMPGSFGFKGVLPDILASAGANVGIGVAGRYANSEILERNGYSDMAKQYKVFDAESIATDAIIGAFFAGVARRADLGMGGTVSEAASKINESMPWYKVDDALAVREARHADTDTAPGIPADAQSMSAHLEAMAEVEAAVTQGRSPDFRKTGIDEATYVKDPVKQAAEAEIVASIREQVPVAARPSMKPAIPARQEPLAATAQPKVDTASPAPEKAAEGKAGQTKEPVPLEVQAAEQALAERPKLAIGDGLEEPVLARDVLAKYDAEIASANEISRLIEVAASCALRA